MPTAANSRRNPVADASAVERRSTASNPEHRRSGRRPTLFVQQANGSAHTSSAQPLTFPGVRTGRSRLRTWSRSAGTGTDNPASAVPRWSNGIASPPLVSAQHCEMPEHSQRLASRFPIRTPDPHRHWGVEHRRCGCIKVEPRHLAIVPCHPHASCISVLWREDLNRTDQRPWFWSSPRWRERMERWRDQHPGGSAGRSSSDSRRAVRGARSSAMTEGPARCFV